MRVRGLAVVVTVGVLTSQGMLGTAARAATSTPSPSASASLVAPVATAAPKPISTPTVHPSVPTATVKPTVKPSASARPSAEPLPIKPTPTVTAKPKPTVKPNASARPSAEPLPIKPSKPAKPTTRPTVRPSVAPTVRPTARPTKPPFVRPSAKPQPIRPRPSLRPGLISKLPVRKPKAAPVVHLVTFAARVCPAYTDVFANKARNNIMESLENLGPDTNYGSSEPVSPGREGESPQSKCSPLVGWHFQIGTRIDGRTPDTNLSRVSDDGPTVTTLSSTPLLGTTGKPTGDSVAGAVTMILTDEQLSQAQSQRFWVQGGTRSQPLGPNAGVYGFAALRCAHDNVNGDNVEYASFSSNETHVFCYYYAVTPPPKAGTIIIKKLIAPGSPASGSFDFAGDLSYVPGGAFSLSNGGSESFVRGDSTTTGKPWTVYEKVPDGWTVSVQCSADPSPGAKSTWTSVQGGTGVAISLAPKDTVTCVFTNTNTLKPQRLQISKFAQGAAGAFGWSLTDPAAKTTAGTVTVPAGGTATMVDQPLTSAGTYTLVETLPTSTEGKWQLASLTCTNATTSVGANGSSATLTVDAAGLTKGVVCTLVNSFVASTATLRIFSTTLAYDSAGLSSYAVDQGSQARSATGWPRTSVASTQVADARMRANPATPADSTASIPAGSYTLSAQGPAATSVGAWSIKSIKCSTPATTSTSAWTVSTTVTLTAGATVDCDYVWELIPGAIPIKPVPPELPGAPGAVIPVPETAVTLPAKIDDRSENVLVPKEVVTDSGRRLNATVTCTPLVRSSVKSWLRALPMDVFPGCSVKRSATGKVSVTIVTKPVQIRLTLWADATASAPAYRFTKTWVVR